MADPSTVQVTVQNPKNYLSFKTGSTYHGLLKAAAAQGGNATASYFSWMQEQASQNQTLFDYLADNGANAFTETYDGDGNFMLLCNPPTGAAAMAVRPIMLDAAQTDPATEVSYQALATTEVNGGSGVAGITVGQVSLGITGGIVGTIGGKLADVGMKAAGWACARGVGSAAARMRTVTVGARGSNVQMATRNAGDAADADATADATAEGVTASARCVSFMGVAGGFLIVLGIGGIIISIEMKQFAHQLEIQNLTTLDLTFDPSPHMDTGEMTFQPLGTFLPAATMPPPDPGDVAVVNATSTQYLSSNTSSFKGLGYVMRLTDTQGILPNGLIVMICIPHDKDNSLWVDFDETSTDMAAVYSKRAGSSQVLRTTATKGNYTAVLTINALSGSDDTYTSTLTIHDTAAFPDLLT